MDGMIYEDSQTRTCRECGESKVFSFFEKTTSGYRYVCKLCRYEAHKQRKMSDPVRHANYGKKWREQNKEKYIAYHAEYREKNRDALREANRKIYFEKRDVYNANRRNVASKFPGRNAAIMAQNYIKHRSSRIAGMKKYASENPHVIQRRQAKRRAASKMAAVVWMTELTDLAVCEAESIKSIRRKAFGFDWELDHVIPLNNKQVCGLHVYNNFAVIPKLLNRKKHNKLPNDMESPKCLRF